MRAARKNKGQRCRTERVEKRVSDLFPDKKSIRVCLLNRKAPDAEEGERKNSRKTAHGGKPLFAAASFDSGDFLWKQSRKEK